MEREQAKELLKNNLKSYVESITKPSRGRNMYTCPLCNSGTGPNGTGAFSIKGNNWKCFACNKGGDIYDLIGEYENIDDYPQRLNRAMEIYGITADNTGNYPQYQNQGKSEQYTHTHIHTKPKEDKETKVNYTSFYIEANKNLNKTNYHRGISLETLNRFNIGYVEEWKHPKAPNAPASPRLIIPTSDSSYLARDTRPLEQIPKEARPYTKSKVSTTHIFNEKALQEAKKPIYIVEGEIDALSIIDVGGEAIALGSTSNKRKLLEIVKETKPAQSFIIALDNDNAGIKARNELIEGLEELDIDYIVSNPAGEYKDANEALVKDIEKFKDRVLNPKDLKIEEEEEKKKEYLKNSTANYLQDFIDGITDSVNTPYIPTGFSKLDYILDGGLYEGLYIVGAISSLGKTTLITQIADQVAQAGQDVLIFSLEMARAEIMAKSISRQTIIEVLNTGQDTSNAKTTRGITTGKRYSNYSETEKELINKSILNYSEYANHIYITEGVGNIGVEQIKETVGNHIKYTGNKPLVIIDYLQILAPYSERATDKQNTDKAVMELKRISRDYKLPIIGISSFNRATYKEKVSMESFKESGAIEYSSDVLIGLQLKGVGNKEFDVNEAKSKNPREVELIILKNRNGKTGNKVNFEYYPMFNYFKQE